MSGRREPEPRPHAKGGFAINYMVNGKRRTAYGATEDKCRANYRAAVRRLEVGQAPRDSRVKVNAWAKTWRSVKLPAQGVKSSTADAYEGILRNWALPTMGESTLASVRESDCEAVLLAMKAAGLSRNYRRVAHSAMRSLFGMAVREGLITVSPMAQVARPAPGRSRAVAMTPEQVGALVAVLSRTPTLIHLVPFLALTGTRRGEALGLRWEDVDEDAGLIHLRWQVTRDREHGLHLSSFKTEAEAQDEDEAEGRDLELTPILAEVLRQRRRRQAKDRLAAPVGTWEDTGLVFTTKLGGMIEPGNVNRAFREAARRAGLPTAGRGKVTPHSLRHSVATLLLAAGTDEKVVAELLGHGVRTLRTTYQHVLRDQRTAALGKVGEALGF